MLFNCSDECQGARQKLRCDTICIKRAFSSHTIYFAFPFTEDLHNTYDKFLVKTCCIFKAPRDSPPPTKGRACVRVNR